MPSEPEALPPAGRHLHPATLLFTLGSAAWRLIVPALVVLVFARGGREEIWLAVLFGPAAIAAVFRYATFRYAFGPEDLVIRRGLIFKNERHVPYARIQSVDLVQNLLQRMLGVAEVRIQTASGNEAEATFRVLSLEAVATMRDQVGRLRVPVVADLPAEGAATDQVAVAPEPATRRLATMPPLEIVRYGLISNRGTLVVAAALGVLVQVSMWTGEQGTFPFDPRAIAETLTSLLARPWSLLLLPFALVAIVAALRLLSIGYAFVAFHDFRLEIAQSDLRTSTGLLTRLTATIPRHRIQILTLHETLLHRLFRRVSVRVATAGGHGGETERTQREDWLVPLLPRGDLAPLLREVLPEVELTEAAFRPVHRSAFRRLSVRRLVVATAILGVPLLRSGVAGLALGTILAVAIILVSWLSARSFGWTVGEGFVAFRSGFRHRTTGIARFSKIQAVSWRQSPFDRRHGTATFEADAAGAVGPHHRILIPFVPVDEARTLAATLREGAAGTEFRW